MKIILTALLLLSHTAFASGYEARHLEIIKKAIFTNCGHMSDLTQISSSETVIIVDQGIRDVEYVTQFSGVQRIDQGVFDVYKITVNSSFADMYDHSSRNWGVYSVETVKCELE